MQGSRSFGWHGPVAFSFSLLLTAAGASACSGNIASSDGVNQSGDELKGGVPANGKDKNNHGKHVGQAGSAAASGDADGGVKEHGKSKADKPEKVHPAKGPKAHAGSGAGEQDEASDENADTDESANTDESA